MLKSQSWTVRLLLLGLILGGLRNPYLFSIWSAGVWLTILRQKQNLGPALSWIPWLLWAIISMALSAQPLAGLPTVAKWTTAIACASIAAAWTNRERQQWLTTLLAVAGVLGTAALFTGAPYGWRNTMTGLMPPYANYTTFALSAAASAAAGWILHPRGLKGNERRIATVACLFFLVCIVLARSRGAWLGLGAAALFWSIRRWGSRAVVIGTISMFLVALALALGWLPSLSAVLQKSDRIHAEVRPRLWRAAAAIATDNPWRGTGPGNFSVAFQQRPVPLLDGAAVWGLSTSYAHSDPLQVAAETGWLGFSLWIFAAIVSFLPLFGKTNEDPIADSAALAAVAMSAQLSVDNMLHMPALAALWISALALAAPGSSRLKSVAAWPRPLCFGALILALVSWIPRRATAFDPMLAVRLFPRESEFREALAYRLMAAGRALESENQWTAAEYLAPFNAIYPWRKAQFAAATKSWNVAEQHASRAIALEPGFMSARILRAESLIYLNRKQDARNELETIVHLRATRADVERHSGYDIAIRVFDRKEFNRVAALAGRPPL